ncbi:MAG: hypothetical protein QQW96_04040 [Tychonema bourrellyi B0820]|nr:hypothetical protein [Tychonema bourrellyi B0820]PJE45191.1 MAG: hypothetical protein CUR32_00905 [Flavobacterium sp.] [Flavobacterium sp. FEMGT703F]
MNKSWISEYCVKKLRNLINDICSECEKRLLTIASELKPKSIKVRDPMLEADEKELIELFHKLQSEGIGRNWRAAAAKKIGWSEEKINKFVKRAKSSIET